MTLPTPTKEGYLFSHYIINNNSYTTEIDDINEINNKELIAKWKHKKYQIIYELDGGKLEEAITEYTIDDEFTIPIPKKDNYIFLGWTTDNNETPNKEINICKGTTGDLYFKANWQEIKYHVKVISLIDNKIYNEGLEFFTFNVWINDILVEEEIINYDYDIDTEIVTKYPANSNPAKTEHIYSKDSNGNYEKFLLAFDNNKEAREYLFSIEEWLFEMMEENGIPEDITNTIPYLKDFSLCIIFNF